MIFEESYTLHNGAAIPKLALGTWFIDDDKAAEAAKIMPVLANGKGIGAASFAKAVMVTTTEEEIH